MRELIDEYLSQFHEGGKTQRYHLENFLRWHEDKEAQRRVKLRGSALDYSMIRISPKCVRLEWPDLH